MSSTLSQSSVQHELTKQALGLSGDVKQQLVPQEDSKSSELTNFARQENLLDDEFDEAFEQSSSDGKVTEKLSPKTISKPAPVVSKDINEINRIWLEKRQKLQKDPSRETINASEIQLGKKEDFAMQKGVSAGVSPISTNPLILPFSDRNRASGVDAIVAQSHQSKVSVSGETAFGIQNSAVVTVDSTEINVKSMDESKYNKELEEIKSMAFNGIDQVDSPSRDISASNENFKNTISEKALFTLPTNVIKISDKNPIEFQEDDVFEAELITQQNSDTNLVFCSFEQMMSLFKSPELDYSQIQTTVPLNGWKSIKKIFSGPPKLNKNLVRDRDSIFALAKLAFNPSDELHVQMLKTVYGVLTSSNAKCSVQGSHWSQVGFQGNDPSTDFRACGMLGLFHLTYLGVEHSSLAQKIYEMSLHSTANFPLAVLSINLTKISLQVLREEKLNKMCNARKDVIAPFNELFVALWSNFFCIWSKLDKTIGDFAFVLKDIEASAGRDVKSFIEKHSSVKIHELGENGEKRTEDKVLVDKSATASKNKYAITGTADAIDAKEVSKKDDNGKLNFIGVVELTPI